MNNETEKSSVTNSRVKIVFDFASVPVNEQAQEQAQEQEQVNKVITTDSKPNTVIVQVDDTLVKPKSKINIVFSLDDNITSSTASVQVVKEHTTPKSVSTLVPTQVKPVKIVFDLNEDEDHDKSPKTKHKTKNKSKDKTNTSKSSSKDKPKQNITDLYLQDELPAYEFDDDRERHIAYPVTNGVMLAEEYRKGTNKTPQVDPTGWLASEKYDGVRVLWDGVSIWSRGMNQINAPIWFQSRLPPSFSLDGELFIKRDHFNETSGIIRNKIPNPDDWAPMKLMVFDIPHLGNTYPVEKRLEILKEICHRYGEPLCYVTHIKIKSAHHLDVIHQELMAKGAEGTMIRAPHSYYEPGRSRSLLKVKDQYDAECIVQGWEEGKNRNEGRLGALEIVWENPIEVWEKYGNEYDMPYQGIFKVGSGLTALDRVLMKDAPKVFPVGTKIKVAFSQLQKSGKPKHPSYKGRI